MSTTTSSEDAPQDQEPSQREFETSEDNEDHATAEYTDHEEPSRKRRRTASEKIREIRMQRYAKSRLQEMKGSKSVSAPASRQRTPSVDHSMTRSEDGSRSSPANQVYPRMGKRVRRKPQRWEGDGPERPSRSSRIEEVEDDNNTVSLHSVETDTGVPSIDDPFYDLRAALQHCSSLQSRREIVDTFHTWQLRVVSKQSAQYKALHVYLKRRIRKRSARMPDMQKMEEDALRSARKMATPSNDVNEAEQEVDDEEVLDNQMNENKLVPSQIRLPLEAYLPRRIRKVKHFVSHESLLSELPMAPHYPGTKVEKDEHGRDICMKLPTVTASADWNSRKTISRRRATPVKEESRPSNGVTTIERAVQDIAN